MDELRGHLVDVCKDARAQSGTSKTVIAAAINKGEQSVSRFEQGVGGWHGQTGELVDAYAAAAGVRPIALWQSAIDRWKAAAQPHEGAGVPPGRPHIPEAPASSPQAQSSSAATRKRAGG